MHSSQNGSLLLAAGRRSTALWLLAGRLSDPGLKADTYAAYDRLAAVAPWTSERELCSELVFDVLAAAAVYTALIERGQSSEEAVAAVTQVILSPGPVLAAEVPARSMVLDGGRRARWRLYAQRVTNRAGRALADEARGPAKRRAGALARSGRELPSCLRVPGSPVRLRDRVCPG